MATVPDAHARGRWTPLWWVLPLLLLTTAGLVFLAWYLLMTHALAYGSITVFWPATQIDAPALDRYATALVVGGLTNVVVSLGGVWLAAGTRARRWPAAAVGGLCAAVAALVSAGALLLVLRLNPIDVLVSF